MNKIKKWNEFVKVVRWLGGSGAVGSLFVRLFDSFLLLSQTRRAVSANIKQNSSNQSLQSTNPNKTK